MTVNKHRLRAGKPRRAETENIMKSYLQLTNLASAYYDAWTSDGIDDFHADADEIAAWLKREDLRASEDADLELLTNDEIATIADMIADMVKGAMTEPKDTLYILRDLDGYGSTAPVCVTRESAEELMRSWYAMTEAPEFDEIWREADADDVAEYGTGDE